MSCVTKIDWLDPVHAVPAFATIAMCVLTYSISYGIGIGLLAYVGIRLGTGTFCKDEDGSFSMNDVITSVIVVLFILMFLLTH